MVKSDVYPRSIAIAFNRLKPEIGRGSHLMHTDLRGLNLGSNLDLGLNQMVIRPFPRHPRSIALSFHQNLLSNADKGGSTQITS